tara:strand:- start:627 stop:1280 length:654 start_codon:yes stop_codon:yes gene_type:complete
MNFSVRFMNNSDISEVAKIERQAFPTMWPPISFKRELTNKSTEYLVIHCHSVDNLFLQESDSHTSLLKKTIKKVQSIFLDQNLGKKDSFIAGYIGIWFSLDEAHITSIATREEFRRMGLGEMLLVTAFQRAFKRRSNSVTLEVRVSNVIAQNLYLKYNLIEVGKRKRYYSDNQEDALIMTADEILSENFNQEIQKSIDKYLDNHPNISLLANNTNDL